MCPVCKGEMWDNRDKKTKATQPDYRCKDKECKMEWSQSAKAFVPSEFVTAVWDNTKTENTYGEPAKKFEKELDKDLENEKWDKISWGKCKHAYLLKAFNEGSVLEDVEKLAEEWADASMRKLTR